MCVFLFFLFERWGSNLFKIGLNNFMGHGVGFGGVDGVRGGGVEGGGWAEKTGRAFGGLHSGLAGGLTAQWAKY